MNEHLPPIDSNIREHLARRSAGRLPEGLAEGVAAALDQADAEPHRARARARVRWPHLRWTAPRLAGAGLGVALVAILVVAIGVPVLRNGPAAGPAGYPADRALTTSELATLMAGPELPTNTALVASVTIDARTDVCPMNRYPTVGVIEGMGSQVCVMGANVQAVLTTPKATGVFAFRFLGPGYLGLLGEITPASSARLAFAVSDTWPVGGKTFLVEAWLGNYVFSCPTYIATTGGDPLNPDGQDQCAMNWLTDDPKATPSTSPEGWLPPGGGEIVEAGGMRLIDAVPGPSPVHGVYVVRGATGPCPSAPPESSVGCGTWLVLAKVPNMSIPEPSASASPSPSASESPPVPPASPVAEPSGPLAPAPVGVVGPGGRPLTEPEFAALWASDPTHLAGRIAIVKGPVPPAFGCQSWGAEPVPTQTCGTVVFEGQIGVDGDYWAVRVGADGKLSIAGQIAPNKTGFVFTLDQVALSSTSPPAGLQIVDAWLDWEPSLACDTPPYPSDSECGAGAVWSVLTSAPLVTQPMGYPDMQPPPSGVISVDVGLGAYQIYGSNDLKARPIHALYLLSGTKILARLDPVVVP